MKQFTYIIIVLGMLLGCSERKASHSHMQYLLHQTDSMNKADVTFTSDSMARVLVDYFDRHGTTNEQVMAYYLLGRALSDIGEAPAALQTYYDAIGRADTTSSDCNYNTLIGIYGQMAQIFHKQNLPHDEIWAWQHYIDYIRKNGNEENTIVAKNQLIRPYYLLGEKDTVLQIINNAYHGLKNLGNKKRAAGLLSPAIYIYTERKQLDKAKQLIDIVESESGLFDEKGDIVRGREYYYVIKGFYELAANKVDTAEFYFRKAIRYGNESDAYKGLLEIYRQKGNLDSIVHFSKLNEAALDTLHNQMQTNAIHQMSALYNYNRSQREAEQERAKAQEASIFLGYVILIAIILLLIIIAITWLYRKNQKEKLRKIAQLEESLHSAKQQRSIVQEELRKLKEKDYEGMIAEKEQQEAELTQTIEQLMAENEKYKHHKETDHLEAFLESKIAQIFIKKAGGKAERPVPSDAEWRLLVSQFSKDMPAIYKSFGHGDALSPMEQHVCILILLKIPTNTIIMMVNSTPQTISKAKSRANMKLFHKKGANTLENNLFSSLNRL